MSLNLDRSNWKRVKLGDVVVRSRIQVDPVDGGVDRYVAGGHVDTDSVIIQRSGDVADGQMGSTFRYLFKPGQVLFVSARPYLRKIGVPDFAGVVADKTYVLDAAPGNGLLHDILPFLLTSDRFVEYATQEATGSMNPRLLWGAMQRYEFHLPPLDDQKRISDLLWAVERESLSLAAVWEASTAARRAWIDSQLESLMAKGAMLFERTWARSPESGWSAVPVDEHTGRFVLSLAALGPNGYRQGYLKNVPDTPEVRDDCARSRGSAHLACEHGGHRRQGRHLLGGSRRCVIPRHDNAASPCPYHPSCICRSRVVKQPRSPPYAANSRGQRDEHGKDQPRIAQTVYIPRRLSGYPAEDAGAACGLQPGT